MSAEKKTEEFWDKFLVDLEANYTFPTSYCYKFIVPTLSNAKEDLIHLFPEPIEDIQFRESSNGKYTSISINKIHQSAKEIVTQYLKTQHLAGLISL